jgi:hypothetical protein
MWMKSKDGGLAAVLYGPSNVRTTVGPEEQQVEVIQSTNYPFDDAIHFTIKSDRAVTFPLSFRIPDWCHAPRLTVNGTALATKRTENGFIVLHRTFHPGDTVTLTLPMRVALTHWPQNGVGIERGPLVYSLPIKERWASRIEPKYTTAQFPSWEATPESPWNYGIAIDPARLESEVEFRRVPIPEDQRDDPWTHPPLALTVPLRKINDWELQSNPDDKSQKFTPPLPDIGPSEVNHPVERVSLVPYGCTQLRVTIFPAVPGTLDTSRRES